MRRPVVTIHSWVVAAILLACMTSPGFAQSPADKVLKFTFGPASSMTRAGFTKVTAKDVFTPEKGYGFQTAKGLVEYDRGGATIQRPKDEYTASVYGAYRMTSDITCAAVEGQSDNAFVVAVPDGEYTVWLIANDATYDPPLYEVWANDQQKLDVRIPRARFVYMEPFHARATGGQLRIELKGQHGWILSGLVIGKDGPELADAVAKVDRDIFFLTDQEAPNWKEAKNAPANPPLELTAQERQKGYVAFPADYTEQIVPTYNPAREEIGKPLTALATPGEIEPATFCISPGKDLGNVAVELSDFVGEKIDQKIARQNVSIGIVRCAPMRANDQVTKGTWRIVPNMIEPAFGRACNVAAGQVKQWWLTVRIPQDTPAGRYRMSLTVRPEKAPPTVLEWRLLVLPFQLTRPTDKHWGTWLDRFAPVGGLEGPARRGRNTPEEVDRLAKADMQDYREHGFDLVLTNYYFDVKENADGSFSYDLKALPQHLEYLKALGSNAPVVLTIEYACRNIEYRFAEPGQKHVPGTFSPKAHKAIVGLVTHIRDQAKLNNWPKLYYYPIDEPGNNKTENRMMFAENVLKFVHEVPGCQTATTLTAADVQRLGDLVDVRIYAYGHFNRNKVVAEAKAGHPFWYYNNGMFYAHSTLTSRDFAGFQFLRSGAEVSTAWGFAATNANPHNDFDGGHRDWNVIFPGVDAPTPTIYWELCREGVDDCRYVARLQQAIHDAQQQGKTEDAQRAVKVLAALLDPDAPRIDEPKTFGRYRWRIAREILGLSGDQKSSLAFAAVVSNSASEEKLGPNLIADPSFENGPEPDGLPSKGYAIADRYAKPEAKPVGALAVTDEAAHSGKYSLKWDFGKAEGKGFISGRNRYLVVNVQVPAAAAKALRGKRVNVGYWFRLGGGSQVPGMNLRQSGKGEYLGGIEYRGGVEDTAVWNHFETEGRLREDFESLDIHISCRVPDDAELAKRSFFYIDDVSLHLVEEPPLTVATPLDEYYAGETIPWSVSSTSPAGQVNVALMGGGQPVAQQTGSIATPALRGTFQTQGLKSGIYTVQARLTDPQGVTQTAHRQIIVAPDPFEW